MDSTTGDNEKGAGQERRARRRGSQCVTIRDVALRAGVSSMTVSNAINGTGKMAEATRQAVLDAVAELGFAPNMAARSLAGADSLRIGFVHSTVTNGFLGAMLIGALQAAALNGAQLLVRGVTNGDSAGLADTIARLRDNGARGLILSPPYAEMLDPGGIGLDAAVPVAVVAAGAAIPGMVTVRVDDRLAMRQLTTRLLEQGHRRIGFITGPAGHTSSAARLAGYRDALAAFGVQGEESLVMPGDFRFQSAMGAARALLERAAPPTAIMASNDDMAAAVIAVAAQIGLSVPERLAVTGFNDDAIAQTIWPTLTTVHQPVQAMAEQALARLIRRMKGQSVDDDLVLDFALMERASTSAGPARP